MIKGNFIYIVTALVMEWQNVCNVRVASKVFSHWFKGSPPAWPMTRKSGGGENKLLQAEAAAITRWLACLEN